MPEKRHKEFAELSVRAEKYLECPNVSLPHHRLVLRLWHYPSFESHISWFIYSPLARYQKSKFPLVREVTWNRLFDAQRLSDPLKGLKDGFSVEPTISFREALIDAAVLETKLAELRKQVLPVFIDGGSIGLDGEHNGIETFGFNLAIRLSWCEGYEELMSLSVWAEEMRRFFNVTFEKQPLMSDAI